MPKTVKPQAPKDMKHLETAPVASKDMKHPKKKVSEDA